MEKIKELFMSRKEEDDNTTSHFISEELKGYVTFRGNVRFPQEVCPTNKADIFRDKRINRQGGSLLEDITKVNAPIKSDLNITPEPVEFKPIQFDEGELDLGLSFDFSDTTQYEVEKELPEVLIEAAKEIEEMQVALDQAQEVAPINIVRITPLDDIEELNDVVAEVKPNITLLEDIPFDLSKKNFPTVPKAPVMGTEKKARVPKAPKIPKAPKVKPEREEGDLGILGKLKKQIEDLTKAKAPKEPKAPKVPKARKEPKEPKEKQTPKVPKSKVGKVKVNVKPKEKKPIVPKIPVGKKEVTPRTLKGKGKGKNVEENNSPNIEALLNSETYGLKGKSIINKHDKIEGGGRDDR